MKQFARSLRHLRRTNSRNFAKRTMDLENVTLTHAHSETAMGFNGQLGCWAVMFVGTSAMFLSGSRQPICFQYIEKLGLDKK